MNISDFDYNLPEELIAQEPVEPRDTSRLMVLHRDDGRIEHRHRERRHREHRRLSLGPIPLATCERRPKRPPLRRPPTISAASLGS